ncbi:MAG: peptidylprolyl isomerase, partial [Rubrobacteridae bacterium]|nr:peptidylprolyl isomerase [Rubrobacteridae bacterium]
MVIDLNKKYSAVIETKKGKIVIELFPKKAPKTVENFVMLTKVGFYDGIKWHRVEPDFIAQTGDPFTKDDEPGNDGYGGPGFMIKAEINDLKHKTGTVAMARDKPLDRAGSQFYIC